MLFTVNFKAYLVFVLPPTLITTAVLNRMTEELYTGTLQCPALFENHDFSSTLSRDIVLLTCFSYALHSHCNTLVNRFINNEKAL